MDLDKLEGKIDRVAAGATKIHMGFGGVKFQTMMELMEFSKLMAVSGAAVPFHLRGNPGACLAICTKALRFGFDPFALAEHSFSMKKDVEVTQTNPNGGRSTVKEPVETIAYDSYVIRAVIEAHAPVEGRLKYTYEGDGDEMTCTVTAVPLGEKEPISFTSPTLGQRKKDIGTSDKGYLKGSPLWITKPRVQLGYDTGRDFCRLHFPEVLMGWYDKDEFDEYAKAALAKDVTPASTLKDRLAAVPKGEGRGFSADHVTDQIGHSPGVTLDASVPAKEPLPVATGEAQGQKGHKRKVAASDVPKPSDVAPAKEPEPPADETSEWLDEQIAIANNVKSMTALDELDPMVWKRLGADGRKKDLGPKWEAEGFDPNQKRLTAST